MRRIENSKLESLGKSVGLDQEDLVRIKSSNRKKTLNKLNPSYWLGQVLIFLISLFYSMLIGIQKREATYPFEYTLFTLILAPIPLSTHIINGVYSIKGDERLV